MSRQEIINNKRKKIQTETIDRIAFASNGSKNERVIATTH
jgi:hypothetical protein